MSINGYDYMNDDASVYLLIFIISFSFDFEKLKLTKSLINMC